MQIYGILANPAGHSLSPALHNAAFKSLGLDAYYYSFDIVETELEDFMASLNDGDVCGLSVSLPYKEKVMNFLDEIDEDARAIGAVNTIKNENGKLFGSNTDWLGIRRALSEVTDFPEKKCAVLGAGGSARAAVYALKKAGVREIWILNRTTEKAESLAKEFDCQFGSLDEVTKIAPDIIVQTTSIWLEDPQAKLIDAEALKPGMIVMDIVYKPLLTLLLIKAKERGCTIVTGDKMLLYQAVEQFKIWTGQEAPMELMEQALKQKLYSN